MSEQELTWLAEHASRSHLIVEIGSWRGRSTRVLADHTLGLVFAVDHWLDSAVGFPDWWTARESQDKYRQPNWLWDEFHANLGDCLGSRVMPLRMSSVEAARLLSSQMLTFDMIFIDGDHSFESVQQDIQAWQPLLRPGGVLAGHDFGDPRCPDVARAVQGLVSKVALTGTIWQAA